MGWLRELMSAASPPYKSYDALAEAALGEPGWPADYRPQARSLAAIFSKLDREVELEWLVERPEVQLSLSNLLGRPVPDFQQAHGRAQKAEADGRHVRLGDVRYARSLDLLSEELCPGIPAEVLTPSRWQKVWWHAPSGSGRSLAGRWLSARGLARFVTARSWTEALPSVPQRGAVFVELEGWEPLASGAARDGICVAAAHYPAERCEWRIVESPKPGEYLEALLDWLGARLPGDGRFQQRAVFAWLTGPALLGHIDSLGVALGLCGLVDEHGLGELEGKRFAELARLHFTATLSRASKAGNPDASWVRRLGYATLRGLGRALLTDTGASWDEARSLDAWLELVPEEQQRGADLDWMKLSLALANSPLQARDLEKAARKVPPGAYRIVRTLQGVGMLRAHGAPETLRIEPRWLSDALLHESRSGLVRLSPLEWGEALLRPSSAGLVAQSLYERVRSGDYRAIEDVLDLSYEDEHPAQVAALEMVFVVVGLVLLEGAELPVDQLEAIWDEQLRLCVEIPATLLARRIDHTDDGQPLLAAGMWLLAALAIAEQLPSGRGIAHRLLRPWSSSAPSSGLAAVYDRIAATLQGSEAQRWLVPALALVDRIRSSIGSVERTERQAHPLELPGVFLDEVEHAVPAFETWLALAKDELGARALSSLAAARGVEWSSVAEAVFTAWEAAEYAAEAEGIVFDERWLTALWPHAPGAWLCTWLARSSGLQRNRVYPSLTEQQWAAIADLVQVEPFTQDVELWKYAPVAWIAHVLSEHGAGLPDPGIAELWRRDPNVALEAVRAAISRRDFELLLALIERTPLEKASALMGALQAALDPGATPADSLDRLRLWLHARIAGRGPEWQGAYAVLVSIERALLPVRAQRSLASQGGTG